MYAWILEADCVALSPIDIFEVLSSIHIAVLIDAPSILIDPKVLAGQREELLTERDCSSVWLVLLGVCSFIHSPLERLLNFALFTLTLVIIG